MDVSPIIGDTKFNYRVAGIIRNKGKILLHKNEKEDFYAIPGGRIKIGEDSISAMKREVSEEIEANIIVSDMKAVIENFFELEGMKYHEVMLVYNVDFEENSELYNQEVIKVTEEGKNINFIWEDIDNIKNLNLKPKVLKSLLLEQGNGFVSKINVDK